MSGFGFDDNKISIVVPMYNAARYIDETLKSVLSQTYEDWELIIVDDGSTDGSPDIVRGYLDPRVRLLYVPDALEKGAYAARNLGVSEAKGRYIAFLDADDKWNHEKLERQLRFMKANNAGFSFTGYEFADENAVGTGVKVTIPLRTTIKQALKNTYIFTSTVMIDREIIPAELIKMPKIKSEDTATWWNILKAGYTGFGLNENLVTYRRPAKSLSSNKLEAIRRIWNLYRKIAGLGVFKSAYYFCHWAVTAVLRRV